MRTCEYSNDIQSLQFSLPSVSLSPLDHAWSDEELHLTHKVCMRGAWLWNQRAVPQVYLERDIARLQDKSGSSNPRVKREVNKQRPCTINWAGKDWARKGFLLYCGEGGR
jgi:hypothetical protein